MITKEEIIANFDPNAPGVSGNLFGLPFNNDNAELIIIPVPWEVTVSYSAGTAEGPEAILDASTQVDLFIKDIPDAWKLGISMLPVSEKFKEENQKFRDLASRYIKWLEENEEEWISDDLKVIPTTINEVCEKLNIYVRSQALKQLEKGKMVALLGGDHSTPLGLISALASQHDNFGILQIDAHADLRKAYEDFTYSHASIMYNALEKVPQVSKLVQVGIRDFCEEEVEYINQSQGRVVTFYDEDLKNAQLEGDTWAAICKKIIKNLPKQVYISFDIDGLDPKLCPNTGTPVPGGLEYHQVIYLFKQVVRSGRTIIGFDLNEVSPGEDDWDANVGARLLYQMGNIMAVSQGKLSFTA
ncbi:Agmatinase [Fulvivirga imtechensis AK7]|uniref:Agmatinase n=1 Tax=Fulvivirga imtechensis AK7 TaxID=1237149 RepID=L8JYX8_9BACT|nr:agmatinase family protein [Fulvivirga imtechensis]ELR72412.1 Agmatinase [Fulvivirga imtechensis AK7]